MSCYSGGIRPLDLSAWREVQPLIHISPKLLSEVVARSKRELDLEWEAYRDSQWICFSKTGFIYEFSIK